MGTNEKDNLQTIADIDKVIHEPARLMIMSYLYVVNSADFLFLLRQTGLTKGNLSSHIGKLESAGYINVKKEFVYKIPRTLVSLTNKGREAVILYHSKMKSIIGAIDKPKEQ